MQRFVNWTGKLSVETGVFYAVMLGLLSLLAVLLLVYCISRVRNGRRQQEAVSQALETQRASVEAINSLKDDLVPQREVEEKLKGIEETLSQVISEIRNTQQGQMDAISGQLRKASLITQDSTARFQEQLNALDQQVSSLGASLRNNLLPEQLSEIRETISDGFRQLKSAEDSADEADSLFTRAEPADTGSTSESSPETLAEKLDRTLESLNGVQRILAARAHRTGAPDALFGLLRSADASVILHALLNPQQYAAKVTTGRGPADYAIRVAVGRTGREEALLPVDCGFVPYRYGRPAGGREDAGLIERLLQEYLPEKVQTLISPPETTDYAILYIDDADIYLEALRCPGLTERIYARYRVILANPAFLTALVSSCCDGTELCRAERLTAEAQKQLTDLRAEQRAGR